MLNWLILWSYILEQRRLWPSRSQKKILKRGSFILPSQTSGRSLLTLQPSLQQRHMNLVSIIPAYLITKMSKMTVLLSTKIGSSPTLLTCRFGKQAPSAKGPGEICRELHVQPHFSQLPLNVNQLQLCTISSLASTARFPKNTTRFSLPCFDTPASKLSSIAVSRPVLPLCIPQRLSFSMWCKIPPVRLLDPSQSWCCCRPSGVG